MKLLAKQNRELIMVNAQNTQNENDAEKIILKVPEQYEDFNKKIVFVTPDGIVWDLIVNDEYLIKKAITKYKQVDFYIWLTKGDVDFRSQTKTLKFYQNVDASDEITDEEIGRVNTVINLLEEEITKVENLESQVDGKLEEVDTAIDNINTAIQETENLNLDAEKVGQTTTITLIKKDGTTKVVHIDDGVDLQFMWQGTSLGIKTAEQQEYTFVNLQGVQGQRGEQGEPFTIKKTYSSVAEMNADFNNMQLGDYVMIASTVEVEDNAKLYTRGENQWIFITDFSGATGIRGETGLTPNIQIGTVTQGTSFNVTRTGTNENPVLNFTLVKGDKGDRGIQGIQGLTGNGISSITKTSTSGLVDTYTITYTNGNTTTFTITNGEDGEVTETELNVLRQKVADQQKVINQLPQVTGQGTSITLENTIEAPFTIFDVEGNSTQDGTPSPDNEVPILSAGDNENLFDTSLLPITKNGVTISKDSKGNVVLNGTPTITSGYIGFDFTLSSTYLKADTYTISVKNKIDGIGTTINQTTPGEIINLTMSDTVKVKTGTLTADLINGTMGVNVRYDVGTLDNFILNPKLEKGNKATPYSPYGMGSITKRIVNGNYFNIADGTYIANNNEGSITFENGIGKVTIASGTSSSFGIRIPLIQPAVLTANQSYTRCNNSGKAYPYVSLSDSEAKIMDSMTVSDNGIKVYTPTENKEVFYIYLWFSIQSYGDIKLMMTKGSYTLSTMPDFVVGKGQTYTIPTQQPFRSIKDVRDCFVKKDGSWFERHYIGEVVLNSTEYWKLSSSTSDFYEFITYSLKPVATSSYTFPMASHFGNATNNRCVAYRNQLLIRVPASMNITNATEFKNWLQENNVTINYLLAEPLDLPCTETQIQQLENMPSTYKDFTIIQSQDETPAYLEVTGIYDLNNLINN